MDNITKFPRTRHLEGSNLQIGDQNDRIPLKSVGGRHAVIEEKMDGANSGISFSNDCSLLLQSRGHYLVGGGRERHFDLFKSWANLHVDALFDILGTRYIMYGEWMNAKHTVFYDNLEHRFLEFDIWDKNERRFLSTPRRQEMLKDSPVKSVPVLYTGPMPSKLKDLTDFIGNSTAKTEDWKDRLIEACVRKGLDTDNVLEGTDDSMLMEGLYVKFENDEETTDRAKWVRSDFTQIILDNDEHWLSRPIIQNLTKDDIIVPRNGKRSRP